MNISYVFQSLRMTDYESHAVWKWYLMQTFTAKYYITGNKQHYQEIKFFIVTIYIK